jgi:transposase-like protein
MKVTSNGKVRRSETEWREIFARCEQSGLSRSAFCRREGIAKASFDKWRHRLPALSDPSPNAFVELSVPRDDPARSLAISGSAFEMIFPGGVVLRWKS